MNSKHKLGIGLACFGLAAASMHAQSLMYSATAPTFGPHDVTSLVAGINDAGNVAGGDDAGTYLAHDRGAIDQTFTTGNNPLGYSMTGFWLQYVSYENTWLNVSDTGGVQLTYRLTDPAAANSLGFVLSSATYNVTGTEPNNPGSGFPTVGTGTWMFFSFGESLILAPETTYGVDVATASGAPNFFIETAGTNEDVYPGGTAYSTARGDSNLTVRSGDHVFGVSLTAVPEPSACVLWALGLGVMFLRRRLP